MTTLEYLQYKRNNPCDSQKLRPILDTKLHDKLGPILSRVTSERQRMEVNKPELISLPGSELDFIF